MWTVLEGDRPTRLAEAADVGMTDELWLVIERCWAADPVLRPTVDFVANSLRNMYSVDDSPCDIYSGDVFEAAFEWPTESLDALENWRVLTLVRFISGKQERTS